MTAALRYGLYIEQLRYSDVNSIERCRCEDSIYVPRTPLGTPNTISLSPNKFYHVSPIATMPIAAKISIDQQEQAETK